MIAIRSEFQFDDFFVLRFSYQYIDIGEKSPQVQSILIKETTDKYSIDIDYAFVDQERKVLFCKAVINNSNDKLPGYSIFVEGAGFFDKNLGKDLPPDRYANEVQLPAINQGINQLRNAVANFTAHGPLGRYQFPMVDLGELIKAKNERLKEKAKQSSKSKGS